MELGATSQSTRHGAGRGDTAWLLARWRGFVLMVGLVGLLCALPVRPGLVVGDSMRPTFHSGQIFLMSRVRDLAGLTRGDVVVFERGGSTFIKRIAALPGDEVWGVGWDSRYGTAAQLVSPDEVGRLRALLRRHPALGRLERVRVPAAHVFVVGDAANNSVDSRQFGPVPMQALRGRVLAPLTLSEAPALNVPKVMAFAWP